MDSVRDNDVSSFMNHRRVVAPADVAEKVTLSNGSKCEIINDPLSCRLCEYTRRARFRVRRNIHVVCTFDIHTHARA